jgi:serine/threonine-protein kinase
VTDHNSQHRTLADGKYRLLAVIGQGGMGRVYRALHTELQLPLAIKELALTAVSSPEERNLAINRFLHEAHLLAQLVHPSIPRVYDSFFEQNACYLVMDFVEGFTLAELLQREGPLPPPRALRYAIAIAEVLHYLHSQRPPIIFRDLKPANLMITPFDDVRVIDFGIARRFKRGEPTDTADLGTHGYAPPEQYRGGGQTDTRTDLFSLGVILHEMVTGQTPPPFPTVLPPASALIPDISVALDTLIATATQLDRNRRFQSARAFEQALERTLQIEEQRATTRQNLPHRNASRTGQPQPGSSLMIPCPQCRAINTNTARHCRICHHPLDTVLATPHYGPEPVPPVPLPQPDISPPAQQWARSTWRLFAFVIIIVSITGGLLSLYALARPHLH